MTQAGLVLSLRRRLFYAMLAGFALTFFLQGTLDFVLSCPLGGLLAALLFFAWSPVHGKARWQGAGFALLSVLTFPILMLLFSVGHLGLYEPADPLVPFPVRLVVLLLSPCVIVFFAGRALGRRSWRADAVVTEPPISQGGPRNS